VFSTQEIIKNKKTMLEANNVKKLETNNVKNNVNNVVNKLTNNVNHRKVEDIAKQLVERLNAINSYKLFCSIAYKNDEQLIWRLVGEVLEKKDIHNKGGYFVSLIKVYGSL
jgi:hypothetical protein